MRISIKILLSIGWLILYNTSVFSAIPTIPSSNISFSGIDGDRLLTSFTKGDGSRRIIIARADAAVTSIPMDGFDYNHNSIFGAGDELNMGEFVVSDGTGAFAYIRGLSANTTYHFAVFEYNGSDSSTEYLIAPFLAGSQATLSAPTVTTSGISFTEVTGHSFKINWTNGNGDNRIVLVKESSAVDANPVDLTSYYSNPTLGNGSQIGMGNYVVYAGSGTSITVRSLEPLTNYHVEIFEYNGTYGPVNLVPGSTADIQTSGAPTITSSNSSFPFIGGNRISTSFMKGNGFRRLIVAKLGSPVTAQPLDGTNYASSSTFGSGAEIEPGQFVIFNGTGQSFTVFNLMHSSDYYFKVIEYNGTDGNIIYMNTSFDINQSTISEPTLSSTNLSFSNITGNSVQLQWTNGDGNLRMIVARSISSTNVLPNNYQNYSNWNGSFTSSSTNIGQDNHVVYKGNGSTATVTNLAPNTTYVFSIYEYNGTSNPVFLFPPLSGNEQTVGAPSISATNIIGSSIQGSRLNLSWTKGNGSRRIIIAKEGSPVTANPVDGSDYLHNNYFGTGDEISPNEFVVYDGTGTSTYIYDLNHTTDYHFKIFEYNGTGNNTFYRTISPAIGSQMTVGAPSAQASNIIISDISPTEASIEVTAGNGVGRIILAKLGAPVDADPTDLTHYPANYFFGSGVEIGTGNFIIYNGAGTTSYIRSLLSDTTYHIAVYERNGSNNGSVFAKPPIREQFTTLNLPTVQSHSANFYSIGATRINVNWSKGDGSHRIVLARKDMPVDSFSRDSVNYLADATFGVGDEIGNGNFVVYNGTGSSFIFQGEESNTYYFSTFEYGGRQLRTKYLRPGYTTQEMTSSPPTITPTNITVNNLTATSATIGWTNGNGTGRMVVLVENDQLQSLPTSGTYYSSHSSFGTGAFFGNGYVVFNNTPTSINVNNLQDGTTYFCYVFEYNGIVGSPAFNTTITSTQFTTPGPPQIAADNLTFNGVDATSVQLNWQKGSGQKRIILARAGSAVNQFPVNGTDYTANSAFGAGSALMDQNYVVYESDGESTIITNLETNTTYHFAIYEFNFAGTNTRYLTSSFEIGSVVPSTVLPIELISFSAIAKNKSVLLNWSTGQEVNSSYFEIERSRDGQHFIPLAEVEAAESSWSQQNYSFLDKNPMAGINFYRLRLVDIDKSESFSNLEIVDLKYASSINVYPNPARNKIFITNQNSTNKTYTLWSLSGQKIKSFQKRINSPSSFDISDIPSGTYYLSNGAQEGVKIIIQEK